MDRLNPSSKDCIVPLIEENSPCIQSNKPEIDSQFLLPQFSQMFQNPDLLLQTVQLEQFKLQAQLYSQMNNLPLIPDEPRVVDLLTQQLLQQQLMINAALLNQFQGGGEIINQSQTKDLGDSKIKRKHIKKAHNPQFNTGHWSAQEHQVYLNFLQQHKEVMESSELKKTNKIFKLMSDIIKSRSPSQCRSHHQKFNPYSKYLINVSEVNQFQNNIVRRKMKEQQVKEPNSQQNQNQQQSSENDNIQQQYQESNLKIESQQQLQESNLKIESQQQIQDSNIRDDQQQASGSE